MATADVLEELRTRLLARESLLFLETWEEDRWEEELAEVATEIDRGLVVWTATSGPRPPLAETTSQSDTPLEFLDRVGQYPPDHLFLLKDFHPFFTEPRVVRKIRDMLSSLRADRKALVFLGPVADIPLELRKEASTLELPLPGLDEMRGELRRVLSSGTGFPATIDERAEEHLVRAVLGLTANEARRALARVMLGRETIDDEVYAQLVTEKKHMIEGSDLLEFFDLDYGVNDIGGLEGLKEWLAQRADAFTTQAQQLGISNPKGVLLLGVQGCGKSLTCRAIARLLGFPLVRLDIANLLDPHRGSSEQNLRDVLRLVETIAPSVLWLEEIDKAFAGFAEEAANDPTMARIVGRFLTWLQEHEDPVFVVATANRVSHLPPELLRRGRFDEIFFVDLPNYYERMEILGIHLGKRGWKPEKFDIDELSTSTDGYSGAELEQIVNSAIIESHAQRRVLTQEDLNRERGLTVPLSVTMEDEIFALREWARTRCRPATPDYRVINVMEEEVRRGEQQINDGKDALPTHKWIDLAEHGQMRAAIIEYVRLHDHVTFAALMADYATHAETSGEFGLALRADPRVVICTRMSRELADVIADLVAGKRLYLNPVAADRYSEAATRPRLPIVEDVPDEKVETPSWLPVTLRLAPPPGGSRRLSRVVRIRMGKSPV